MLPDSLSYLRMDSLKRPMTLADWSLLRFSLNWIYEGPPRTPTAEHELPPPGEERLCAWLLTRGRVTVRTVGDVHDATAGTWVFLPYPTHAHEFSADARVLSLAFSARWLDGRQLFDERVTRVIAAGRAPLLAKAARALQAVVQRWFPGVPMLRRREPASLKAFLAIEGRLADWVAAYAEAMIATGAVPVHPHVTDERTLAVLRLLEAEAPRRHLTEAMMARHAGLSVSQLNRLFVRAYGITPRTCAERYRAATARDLILSTTEPIKGVAYSLGFSQPSHFARWFREQYKLYPAAYRRKYGRGHAKATVAGKSVARRPRRRRTGKVQAR